MKSVLKKIVRATVYLFAASLVYMVACKWIWPPVTIIQLQALYNGGGIKRDYISWDKMSDNIKLAAIASEDQLFATHNGFDWKALEQSIEGKRGRKKTKGSAASTITQQTAKNVFLWQGDGYLKYVRKVFEFVYTWCIELIWGKKRILEVYLNVIETGPGIFGVEAAAQNYFNKPASQLTQKEAAMIVACLPNPRKYTVLPMSRRVAWRHPQIVRQMNNVKGFPAVKDLLNK